MLTIYFRSNYYRYRVHDNTVGQSKFSSTKYYFLRIVTTIRKVYFSQLAEAIKNTDSYSAEG